MLLYGSDRTGGRSTTNTESPERFIASGDDPPFINNDLSQTIDFLLAAQGRVKHGLAACLKPVDLELSKLYRATSVPDLLAKLAFGAGGEPKREGGSTRRPWLRRSRFSWRTRWSGWRN